MNSTTSKPNLNTEELKDIAKKYIEFQCNCKVLSVNKLELNGHHYAAICEKDGKYISASIEIDDNNKIVTDFEEVYSRLTILN